MIEAVDELLAAERFADAQARVEQDEPQLEPAAAWVLGLRRAQLQLRHGPAPIDDAILTVEAALQSVPAGVSARERARAHAMLVEAFTAKRCFSLAEAAAERGHDAVGPRAELELALAHRALALDDRSGAAAHHAQAHLLDPNAPELAYAQADLAYVQGQFERCTTLLASVTLDAGAIWARAQRLCAATWAAVQRYDAEAEAWTAVLERLPDSDRRARDFVGRGLAHAAADNMAAAEDDFQSAWRIDPSSGVGRYASERLGFLASPEQTAHKRLAAFPSTQQKRNYCGPAVLELCLRYLDFDLRQDEIARVVRRGEGTPMCAIVDYLDAQGIEARRIKATPERLRAAIDLDLPVIVQEEYATTSHVAVITGYDARVGLFIAADPATHRPTLKSFKWVEAAGDLFGNGGLIVLGRRGPQLEAMRERADAVGLVQLPALELLDECDRRRAGAGGAVDDAVTADEVVRLCDEAIGHDDAFKLAWERRTDALMSLWSGRRGDEDIRGAFLRSLQRVRTRWPYDEWTHQLHARYLDAQGRTQEAFLAWFEAWRRDPDDANDLAEMGFCKWQAGDLVAGERHMLAALARSPACRTAARGLAMVYLRQLADVSEAEAPGTRDAAAADPFARARFAEPRDVARPLTRAAADVRRRLRHFAEVSLDHAPDDPFALGVRAQIHRQRGDRARALDDLARAVDVAPNVAWTRLQYAACLEADGRVDDALAVLEHGCRTQWRLPTMWLSRADALARRGDVPAGAEVLVAAIEAGCDERAVIAERLFELYADASTRESAASRLRALAEAHRGDDELLRGVAWLLDQEGQRGHAIALFRFVVDAAPGDVGAVFQLGSLLARNLATREEGLRLLERSHELAPDHPAPTLRIATTLLSSDPEAALARLAPAVTSDDPMLWGVKAAALHALGRAPEADNALRRALDCAGDPLEGRIRLVRFHTRHRHYARAVALAEELPRERTDDELHRRAQAAWLAAHRQGGEQAKIAAEVEALCGEDDVPEHLAWEVYWAFSGTKRVLAAAAARQLATRESGADAAQWRVREAALRTKLGDAGGLDAGAELAGEHAAAWAQLAEAFADNGRVDDAAGAAERAFALDPSDVEVLSAMEHVAGRQLRFDDQMALARRILEAHPHEHQGPERVGWLLAKRGEVQEALAMTLQAVDAAPYCAVAHNVRAIALMMADRLDEARVHTRQAEAISPTTADDHDGDHWLVYCALTGGRDRFEAAWVRHLEQEPAGSFPAFEAKVRSVASCPKKG